MLNPRTWSPLLCSTLLAACGGSTSSLSSELPGHWASATCEPAGAAGFLHRDFVIEPDRYQVTLDVFADELFGDRDHLFADALLPLEGVGGHLLQEMQVDAHELSRIVDRVLGQVATISGLATEMAAA